jgi:pantetheine-phosphate adenylyltransferase
MPRFRHVVLGGTFDRFHVGHAALLATAFRAGRRVSVGITSDLFLEQHPKPGVRSIEPYSTRAGVVARWIRARFPGRVGEVVPIDDPVGRSAEEGVDALVVSSETVPGGRSVNARRRRLGRRPIPLLVVPLVLADDLLPVSSRRIRAGEIDSRGRRNGPISVGVGLDDTRDHAPAAAALGRIFPWGTVRFVYAGTRARGGARARAAALAKAALKGHDLALGIARTAGSGWTVVERSKAVALEPRRIPAGPSSALRRGLERILRPSQAKPL